jgi:hypothetical protein
MKRLLSSETWQCPNHAHCGAHARVNTYACGCVRVDWQYRGTYDPKRCAHNPREEWGPRYPDCDTPARRDPSTEAAPEPIVRRRQALPRPSSRNANDPLSEDDIKGLFALGIVLVAAVFVFGAILFVCNLVCATWPCWALGGAVGSAMLLVQASLRRHAMLLQCNAESRAGGPRVGVKALAPFGPGALLAIGMVPATCVAVLAALGLASRGAFAGLCFWFFGSHPVSPGGTLAGALVVSFLLSNLAVLFVKAWLPASVARPTREDQVPREPAHIARELRWALLLLAVVIGVAVAGLVRRSQERAKHVDTGSRPPAVRTEVEKPDDAAQSSVRPLAADAAATALQRVWRGRWRGGEAEYDATVQLTLRADGAVDGRIQWVLVRAPSARSDLEAKIGAQGVEHVRGTFDAMSRMLALEGYRKEDPRSVIGLDHYRLILSEDLSTLKGSTRSHGTWAASLELRAP